MDEDKVVGAVYLDFIKAFDMVDHSLLLLKMARYSVRRMELYRLFWKKAESMC